MPIDIARTRTSDRWAGRRPGNWDRLNTRAIYPGDETYGIPSVQGASVIPDSMTAWNQAPSSRPGSAWHFFLDDYRFETVWNRPEVSLSRVQLLGMALSPDFSLWRQMPMVMQLWQVYRARWLSALWEANGITVIPTVSWSDQRSHEWAWLGIPAGSVVAVSTVGVAGNRASHAPFLAGWEAMTDRLRPSAVLCHGRPIPGMMGDMEIRQYPTRWGRM